MTKADSLERYQPRILQSPTFKSEKNLASPMIRIFYLWRLQAKPRFFALMMAISARILRTKKFYHRWGGTHGYCIRLMAIAKDVANSSIDSDAPNDKRI